MGTIAVTGRARTDRAARYLKQLLSHLGEKLEVSIEEGVGGTVSYEDATATLTVTDDALEFAVTAEQPLHLYRSMGIVQRHLEKFGAKAGLTCEWDDAEIERAYLAARAGAEREN